MRNLSMLTFVSVMCLSATFAEAQSNRVYTQRDLTLSAGTLRLDLAPPDRALRARAFDNRGQAGFVISKGQGVDEHFLDLNVGLGFGVAERVEVGALVAPLALHPDSRETYGNPSVYGRIRLTEGDGQLGLQVGVNIPVVDGTDVVLTAGLPVRFALGRKAQLNMGALVGIVFDSEDNIDVALDIPVELAFNLTNQLFWGVHSAFRTDLDPDAFENGVVPLGAFAGYSIPVGSESALDIQAGFAFTNFVGFGDARDDTVSVDDYQITVGANLYADLSR